MGIGFWSDRILCRAQMVGDIARVEQTGLGVSAKKWTLSLTKGQLTCNTATNCNG